ncbi:hypothetical protein [Amaricoccus solimangrovi]|nr:hypothetical protein [Amaricoccus solimangrovi]
MLSDAVRILLARVAREGGLPAGARGGPAPRSARRSRTIARQLPTPTSWPRCAN